MWYLNQKLRMLLELMDIPVVYSVQVVVEVFLFLQSLLRRFVILNLLVEVLPIVKMVIMAVVVWEMVAW